MKSEAAYSSHVVFKGLGNQGKHRDTRMVAKSPACWMLVFLASVRPSLHKTLRMGLAGQVNKHCSHPERVGMLMIKVLHYDSIVCVGSCRISTINRMAAAV